MLEHYMAVIPTPTVGPTIVRRAALGTCAALALLAASWVAATPPARNDLGTTFSVISRGPTSTIEIRLSPRRSFDRVDVEAGSGVASLSPPCSFSNVVVDGSYLCRIDATAKASDAAMTVNVVGHRAGEAGKPGHFEVGHFTLINPAYVRSKSKPASKPVPGFVTSPNATP
jgi:hypothetical protein